MPALTTSFLRPARSGLEIDVLVQPRASRSRLCGVHDGRLKVQLAAPPVDGEANEALVALIADLLDLPRREIRILRGDSSRRKTLAVVADFEAVRLRLEEALS